MRFFLFFAILLTALQACKSTDTETLPSPSLEVPQSVKELVYRSYPAASNLMAVSELEKGHVYELSFRHDDTDYEVVVSRSGILRASAAMDEAVPDSLVARIRNLAIKGGKLSNYRTIVLENADDIYAADYELNGIEYVIRFDRPGGVSLYTYEKDFRVQNINDLPNAIQQYIAARNRPNPAFINTLTNLNEASRQYIINNNELRFNDCWVQVMADGRKLYMAYVNYFGVTGLPILFDENGRVIWTGSFNRLRKFEQDFEGTPAVWAPNLTSQEITYFRDVIAGSSHLAGFNLDDFLNFGHSYRNEYENNVSYNLELHNSNKEAWYLSYGADKKVVYSVYHSD